jgi:integrase
VPLTNRTIQSLKPKAKQYYAIDRQRERGKGALWLLVRPSGKKEFYYVYTHQQKRHSIGLGPYANQLDCGGITLDEARLAKDKLSTFLINGLDPKTQMALLEREREEEERRRKHIGSIEQLFDGYTTNLKDAGKRSYKEVARSLTKDAIPILGADTPANQITSYDIKLVLHALIKRGALVSSNRLRSYLGAAFAYGIGFDNNPMSLDALVSFQLERNPVRDVPKALKYEPPLDRELSEKEIHQLWSTFHTSEQFSLIDHILKLVLATGGQRISEVSQAKWVEFDLDKGLWEIPAKRTKNGKTHLVPLNELAVTLVENTLRYTGQTPFLFPHRLDHGKPITLASISKATNRFCKSTGVRPFTPRDLRRTCKTKMGELGLSKDIRDRINNHALNDVSSKHYDRYDYLPEKTTALDLWAKYLKSIAPLQTQSCEAHTLSMSNLENA